MSYKFSDLSVSAIDLYEEFLNYLATNNKLKIKRVPLLGRTKLAKKIREKNISKERFAEFLSYFEQVLRYNFRGDLLHNFEDNIEDLEIDSTCFQLGDFLKKVNKYDGLYDIKKNKMYINIKDKSEINCIYHELFHLATTNRMITSHLQTGFRVIRNGRSIGLGLNEGYTDLMAYRYFGHVGYVPGYPVLYRYAAALEQIVGKERMEPYYLSSNPQALVNQLSRYDSTDNIIMFLQLLDGVVDLKEEVPVEGNRMNSITSILLKWYVRKAIMDGENIYDPNVRSRILNYAWQLPSKIILNNGRVLNININALLDNVVNEIMQSPGYNNRPF